MRCMLVHVLIVEYNPLYCWCTFKTCEWGMRVHSTAIAKQQSIFHDDLFYTITERPHTPVNLTASGIGPTWLTLEWTAVFVEHKPIEEYIIAQKSPSASDRNITLENDKQGMPSLSIQHSISSDILPFTNYSFSVRACNHIGCSDESKPVLVTTLQDCELG